MFITNSPTNQLNDLLNRIGQKLQLDDTKNHLAEERYKSLSEFLENDDKFFSKFDINIYPQGSYRLGTMVKPLSDEEYDLDFVLQMDVDYQKINPNLILEYLYKLLNSNGNYNGKLERKSRCVRINYKNDFHIDILPACSFRYDGDDLIKIPDREVKSWLDSNPRGYSEWFENQYIEKKILLEKAAQIEEIPKQKPYKYLQPLQRAVQLIKRYRDIYYENDTENKPSSIILTTLSGLFYGKSNSEYDAINNILKEIINALNNNRITDYLNNPSYDKENFADKWISEQNLYASFICFIDDFYKDWKELLRISGIDGKSKLLSKLFGESMSKTAIKEQTDYINKVRTSGNLGVGRNNGVLSGLTTDIIKSKNHTFFGE